MSDQNVNAVKAMYEAFGKGDIPTVLNAFTQDIVWFEAENFIYADGNPYIGPNAILEGVFMRIAAEWDGFAASPEGLHDAGETVIAYGHYTGTYKKTGKPVKAQFAHFFTLRDGKISRFQQYTDTAQFNKATAS